ncbi:MAG TPA: hypothetical protein VK358_00980 [Longimicrobium sp.]|nr:hypothetical protein [Longimicrobium sp.]
MFSLQQILAELQRHRQRATYGAVGGLIGIPARSVMSGHPKDPLHSWVVRKSNGQPTGYLPVEKDPALTTRPEVISTADELRAWLEARCGEQP